jgi:hypothetical protein
MGRTVKRSVTIDEDLDRELTARFGVGGKSRFLNDTARRELARLKMLDLLDRWDAEDGGIPAEIVEEVRRLPYPR